MDLMEIEFNSFSIGEDVFLEVTMSCDVYRGWNEAGEFLTEDEIKLIENSRYDYGMIEELTEDWRNGR
jgi:hypothetical protein